MSNKRPIQSPSPPLTPTESISPLPNIPKFLTASNEIIAQKFAAIDANTKTLISQPNSTLIHPIIHNRDRYVAVKTFANNQIKLASLDHGYINASPIDLGRSNETFIAT